jgi:hypothetical protein
MSKIYHPLLALIASATDNELAKYVEYPNGQDTQPTAKPFAQLSLDQVIAVISPQNATQARRFKSRRWDAKAEGPDLPCLGENYCVSRPRLRRTRRRKRCYHSIWRSRTFFDPNSISSLGVPAGFNECVTPVYYCTSDDSVLGGNYYPLQLKSAEIQPVRVDVST